MRVQFNGQPTFDTNTMWGYTVEVTDEGVFGEVPDELVASEAGAGRIKVPTKAAKVEEFAEQPQSAQDVINSSGKRIGRPPKVEQV